MATITELLSKALEVQNETEEGQNTAHRVGLLFYEIVKKLGTVETSVASVIDGAGQTTVNITQLLKSGIPIATINDVVLYAPNSGSSGGSDVVVRTYQSSGNLLATIRVDNDTYSIYAPISSGSGSSSTEFDPSDIWTAINNMDNELDSITVLVNSDKSRLDNLVGTLDSSITNKVTSLVGSAEWVKNNFSSGVVAKWGTAELEQYLQGIGVWYDNSNLTKTTWSKFAQKVNNIEIAVNSMSGEGGVTEFIQSAIDSSVENGIADLKLETTYAKKDAENVLEWMYSALKNSTAADKTFAQLVSGGKSGISSSVSEIRTEVQKLTNGEYLATANVETKVNESIASLYNKASATDATTTMFSSVKKNASDIATIVTHATNDSSTNAIAVKFDTWRASLVTQSTLDRAIATLLATNGTTVSSLLVKSDLDSALAALFAKSASSIASLEVIANKVGSSVNINADQIKLNGETLQNWIDEGWYASGVKLDGAKNSIIVCDGVPSTWENGNYVTITPTTFSMSNKVVDWNTVSLNANSGLSIRTSELLGEYKASGFSINGGAFKATVDASVSTKELVSLNGTLRLGASASASSDIYHDGSNNRLIIEGSGLYIDADLEVEQPLVCHNPIQATAYRVGSSDGATGSFTAGSKTITVSGGIITSIA